MKFIPIIAVLLAVAGWVMTALMGINLLSGHFDERTCQTACVRGYFFAGIAAGGVALLLGLLGLVRPGRRALTLLALALALPLVGVMAGIILIGNFA